MSPIVPILTTGKPLKLIDQGIVDAVENGNQVLVKAGRLAVNFPEASLSQEPRLSQKLDSENSAIAGWAEGLSQEHGMIWQRVGPDVLFTRTTS